MTEATQAPVRESTLSEIDAAVHAACKANVQWAASGAEDRSALLRLLAAKLEAEREHLMPLANEETFLDPVGDCEAMARISLGFNWSMQHSFCLRSV
jgi:acyl-CoA reductase-like NAD-dependent aldehyde dehydrogenase